MWKGACVFGEVEQPRLIFAGLSMPFVRYQVLGVDLDELYSFIALKPLLF
jgi:hypothetical protein